LSSRLKYCPDCGKELGAGVVKCWNPDFGAEFMVPVDIESSDAPIKKSDELRQLESPCCNSPSLTFGPTLIVDSPPIGLPIVLRFCLRPISFDTGVTGIKYPVRPDQLYQAHPLKIPMRFNLESRQSEDNACLRQILVQIH
jgi:hypothetical protein